MPLPSKTELEFSKVFESPGTQHVSLLAVQYGSVHWHVPKSSQLYTAMSRGWPSDSKLSGDVSKTVLRLMVWLLPLIIIPLQFHTTLSSMLP